MRAKDRRGVYCEHVATFNIAGDEPGNLTGDWIAIDSADREILLCRRGLYVAEFA